MTNLKILFDFLQISDISSLLLEFRLRIWLQLVKPDLCQYTSIKFISNN